MSFRKDENNRMVFMLIVSIAKNNNNIILREPALNLERKIERKKKRHKFCNVFI